MAYLDSRDTAQSQSGGGGGGGEGGGGGGSRGAVLLFLPGVAEIRRLISELSGDAEAARWLLLPLHGDLPAVEQRRVFSRPPSGMRKVREAI